jgi:ABC-2 type transport system permease protein
VKHFVTLLRHEIGILLINPASYIAAVLFLVLMGMIFQLLLVDYARSASEVSPAVDFFRLFWVPVFFLTPLLTMRSLAEERRRGTIETLLTTPVTSAEVVLAKYCAAYGFYICLWLSTLSFQWVLLHFAEDPRMIDPGPLVGGYLFVALSGLMYIAIGIFASALARSQLVAAMLAVVLCIVISFLFPGVEYILQFQTNPNPLLVTLADHLQIFQHSTDFVSGVFDTRVPVLFISITGMLLFLSMIALDGRSARS